MHYKKGRKGNNRYKSCSILYDFQNELVTSNPFFKMPAFSLVTLKHKDFVLTTLPKLKFDFKGNTVFFQSQ